jgi:hypothetical protein
LGVGGRHQGQTSGKRQELASVHGDPLVGAP